MPCEVQEQTENRNRNQRHTCIKQNLARPCGACFLPIPKLGAVGNSHLIEALKVSRKFVRIRVPVSVLAFKSAINNFLQLGGYATFH